MAGKGSPSHNLILLQATSSHDLEGRLRRCCAAGNFTWDILFLEGNFPFHIPEIARWIGLKVVYLADDPVPLETKVETGH
jgi:hypothetical protein